MWTPKVQPVSPFDHRYPPAQDQGTRLWGGQAGELEMMKRIPALGI